MKKKIIAFLAGLFLSLLFVYLLLKNLDFYKTLNYFSQMNLLWILPFCLVLLTQLILRAIKWRIMLTPLAKTSLYEVFKLETAGLAINNVLPLRIGEIARAFMAVKMFDAAFLSVFSTIALERAVDFLAMIMIFAFFSYIENFSIWFFKPTYFAYIGFLSFLFFLFMIFSKYVLTSRVYLSLSKKHPSISRFVVKIIDGLKSFENPFRGLMILLIAIIQWLCEVLNNYVFAMAFGLGSFVNFAKAGLILCSTAVGVSLPSAPGYFGNFEFAAVKALSLWAVTKEAAMAYAWALHISGYILTTGLGIYYVYSLGHSLTVVFEMGRKQT